MKHKIYINDDEVSVLGELIMIEYALFFHRDGNIKNAEFTTFEFGRTLDIEKFPLIAPKIVPIVYEGEV